MGETLKKPYEISVWEDRLVGSGENSYYQEIKIAVIGSNTMDAPNRVFSPVLTENVNGEMTLTFSLYYRYYDDNEMVRAFVVNPFAAYLVNERKVKLKYDNKWYDFIIKECEENSEEQIFTYTATSAFVQELSKNGYNVTFSTELNNNQGTIIELAKKTLEHTDWTVDEADSDLLIQTIPETIYTCTVGSSFSARNLDTNTTVTIGANETIYIFYSYIKNKTEDYVQFIRATDQPNWTYDSNDAINGTNYRFVSKASYTTNEEGQVIGMSFGSAQITIGAIDTRHQAYRLVYNQLTTYDPVTEHTVDIYKAQYADEAPEIYHYQESEYTTSDLAVSYVTNGSMESVYSGTALNGWNEMNEATGNYPEIEVVTDPPLEVGKSLASLSQMNNLRSFLRIKFPPYSQWKNTVYNSGFSDNAGLIGSVAAGTKFVLRFRTKTNFNDTFRAVVARYTYETKTINGEEKTYKKIDPSGIYLDFYDKDNQTEEAELLNRTIGDNLITGGVFNEGATKTRYTINNIIQTPSFKNVYVSNDEYYYYDFDDNEYKILAMNTSDVYPHYFYRVAALKKPLPKIALENASDPIGLFFFTSNSEGSVTYDIEEVQLFKYITDKNNKVIFPGSAPEATTLVNDYYYLKPAEGTDKDEVDLYTSLKAIADYLGLESTDKIKPSQNEKCEKILSISEEKSNCFNILQTLCETFQCWLKINVEHEDNGAIRLNRKTHKPIKKIAFKEYIGRDNFAGFRYGINLNSIQRTIDSNEFVSKLIVNPSVNDYAEKGYIDIRDAKVNPSGESYILNFNYYINQKLIQNPDDFNTDLNNFNEALSKLNHDLKEKNAELEKLKISYDKISATISVYSAALDAAQSEFAQALSAFENSLGEGDYETYIKNHKENDILDDNTARSLIQDIYSARIQMNNYSGLFENIQKDYESVRNRYKGAQTFTFTVTTRKARNNVLPLTRIVLSDYIKDFRCQFSSTTNEGLFESYTSDINKRTFEANVEYDVIKILNLPENYNLQYMYDSSYVTVKDLNAMSYIITNDNQNETIKRFRVVPDETIAGNIGLEKEIEELQAQKDELERNFFAKYSSLIQEGTWDSSEYIDPELYYLDALQVSFTSAQPKVSYQINVTEISEIEGFENYLFYVGDKSYIEDTDFFGWEVYSKNGVTTRTPVKEEVVVSQVEWHLDEPENNVITVQNYKTQFEDLFQRISAAVQSVQYNQPNYSRAASILDSNGRIDAKLLAASMSGISAVTYDLTANGTVKVTDEGMVIRDLTGSNNLLKIHSLGIDRSDDGGRNWHNLISKKGVNTDELTAGVVNTGLIRIMDNDNPSFRWDKSGISAYGFNENGGFNLKTFVRFDKYGIYGIQNNENYLARSLDDIKNNAQFGLTWDGFFIKNKYRDGYVSISSTDDIQVVANGIERIKVGLLSSSAIDERYGIRITNSDGDPVFETDDNGNLAITGTIYATAGEFSGYLEAREGYIGGFTISDNELYNGNFGEEGSVWLTPGYTSARAIADISGIRTWAIAVSDRFGVTTEGKLYATEANISGVINATDGNFSGYVNARGGRFQDEIIVGKENDRYITIDAQRPDPIIASSDWVHNSSMGWMINGVGDAIFNNVSVRGAIKTAVFEYGEIEAVGGAFLFRPSSTIKEARNVTEKDIAKDNTITTDDLIVTVENTFLFKQNEWVKVSNVNSESGINDILNDGGLTHVYKIKNKPANDKYIVLQNAGRDFEALANYNDDNVPKKYNGSVEIVQTEGLEGIDYYYTMEEGYYNVGINSAPIYYKTQNEETGQVDNTPIILVENKPYYLNFNYSVFTKRAARYHLIQTYYYNDTVNETEEGEITATGEQITEIVENDILYIGNLSILSGAEVNTGEPFVIVSIINTENGEETISNARIYLDEAMEECFLKVFITETGEKPTVDDLSGGSLISFGFFDVAYTEISVNENTNPHEMHYYELNNGIYSVTTDTLPVYGKKYYREQYENGSNNYGIGINSSDNYVNLPERAISLFETKIHPNDSVKVSYEYKGILGTLPQLGTDLVSNLVFNRYMAGTQGIFTNNMYIGDASKYIAFYHYNELNENTGQIEHKTNLRVVADQFIISADDSDLGDLINNSVYETAIEYCLSASTITNTHGTVWMNVMPSPTVNYPYVWQRTKITYNNGSIKYIPDDGGIGDGFYVETATGGSPGEDAIILTINSSNGETFRSNSDTSILTVTLFKGSNEITTQSQLDSIYGTNQVSLRWYWKKFGESSFSLVPNGLLDNDGFTFEVDGSMVNLSTVFQCELIYNEGE